MKYEGEIEKYHFVGDSKKNIAKRIVKGEPVSSYTQTGIIEAFNSNKNLVCGGSKINMGENNTRVGYIIYFGKEKSNPDQIIKIILDKEMLEKGDINALAIDSLCQYAIRINKKNNKKLAIMAGASVLAAIGLAGALIGGLMWASEKEQEIQDKETRNYQDWLQEQRMENGTYKSWLEEQGLIDEESVNEVLEVKTNRRS